jgi:hypothetical protein
MNREPSQAPAEQPLLIDLRETCEAVVMTVPMCSNTCCGCLSCCTASCRQWQDLGIPAAGLCTLAGQQQQQQQRRAAAREGAAGAAACVGAAAVP